MAYQVLPAQMAGRKQLVEVNAKVALGEATAAHAIDAFAGAQFQDPIDNTASPQKVRT